MKVKVVFIDMKGAFDEVWHSVILYKLKTMGIKGRILGWLKSYLSDHKFKVIYKGEESNMGQLHQGCHREE